MNAGEHKAAAEKLLGLYMEEASKRLQEEPSVTDLVGTLSMQALFTRALAHATLATIPDRES